MIGRAQGALPNGRLKWLCTTAVIVLVLLIATPVALAQEQPAAPKPEPQGFSSSNVQILYGWTFKEPGLSQDIPKNIFTFENTAAWSWGSSYLFVDILAPGAMRTRTRKRSTASGIHRPAFENYREEHPRRGSCAMSAPP